MTRSVLRFVYWTIRPDQTRPLWFCQVCETCAERSVPAEDPEIGKRWAMAHSGRNIHHTAFCEEITRSWVTEMCDPV